MYAFWTLISIRYFCLIVLDFHITCWDYLFYSFKAQFQRWSQITHRYVHLDYVLNFYSSRFTKLYLCDLFRLLMSVIISSCLKMELNHASICWCVPTSSTSLLIHKFCWIMIVLREKNGNTHFISPKLKSEDGVESHPWIYIFQTFLLMLPNQSQKDNI